MFSGNGQISIRQTYRLLLFDLIGVGTLLLPTVLADLCGGAGIWCIILGTVLAYLYLLILACAIKKMNTDLLTYLKKYKWIIAILGINAVLMAGMCGYVFTELVRQELVPDEDYKLVLALILLVSAYAVIGGMESRARVYEVLFWFVIIPLIIMLVVAAKDIKIEYIKSVLYGGKYLDVMKGSYLVFISFSTLFYILMFPAYIAPKKFKKLKKAGALALFIAATILLVTYIVLLGNFGATALSNMKFAAVTLMSTVKLEGSFLKRTDAFMLGIWFFTLYALLNINMFHSVKKLEKIIGKGNKKRYVFEVTIAVFIVANIFKYGDDVMGKYIRFLYYVGVPILVVIPIFILFAGCNSTELEDRCFPMLEAVSVKSDEIHFSYVFPELETKEAKEPEKLYSHNGGIGVDYEDAKESCESNLVKTVDINHLKILLLGKSYFEDTKQQSKMLKSLQTHENIPRNAYVLVADDVDDIIKNSGELSEDLGTYLEQLLEKKQKEEGLFLVTIGDLIDENDNSTIYYEVPFLELRDKEYVIETVIKNE